MPTPRIQQPTFVDLSPNSLLILMSSYYFSNIAHHCFVLCDHTRFRLVTHAVLFIHLNC